MIFFKNSPISPSSFFLLLLSLCLQATGSRYQHWKHMAYFKNIPTQVCVVFKFSLSKAIVRYRARVFLPDAIHSRSHKSNSTVVANFFLAAAQGTKRVALNGKCNLGLYSNCCYMLGYLSLKYRCSGHLKRDLNFRPYANHRIKALAVWKVRWVSFRYVICTPFLTQKTGFHPQTPNRW